LMQTCCQSNKCLNISYKMLEDKQVTFCIYLIISFLFYAIAPSFVFAQEKNKTRHNISPLTSISQSLQNSSNSTDNIHIEADILNYKEATATESTPSTLTLTGDVVIKHLATRLEAELVVINSIDDSDKHIDATGDPVRFEHVDEKSNKSKNTTKGRANRVEYKSKTQEFKLSGNALLIQNNDLLEAEEIFYDAKTLKYSASRSPKKRVKMILAPRK